MAGSFCDNFIKLLDGCYLFPLTLLFCFGKHRIFCNKFLLYKLLDLEYGRILEEIMIHRKKFTEFWNDPGKMNFDK